MRTALYVIFGYLSGSVLYARVSARLLHTEEALSRAEDQNPGAFNAFALGGFWCGVMTLLGDLAKGFIPVFFYCRRPFPPAWPLALVLAAPVVGHVLPVFFHFHGGKGIATSFGVLMGLFPELRPVMALAAVFILFAAVIRVTPNFACTIVTYLVTTAVMWLLPVLPGVQMGFTIIAAVICMRLHASREARVKARVKWLWTL